MVTLKGRSTCLNINCQATFSQLKRMWILRKKSLQYRKSYFPQRDDLSCKRIITLYIFHRWRLAVRREYFPRQLYKSLVTAAGWPEGRERLHSSGLAWNVSWNVAAWNTRVRKSVKRGCRRCAWRARVPFPDARRARAISLSFVKLQSARRKRVTLYNFHLFPTVLI